MQKRIRICFDCPEQFRRAVNIWAARTGKTRDDFFMSAVAQLLADDLASASKAIAEENPEETPKPKRGSAK